MFRFFLTCLLLTGISSYSNPALQRRSFVSKAGNTIARVGIFGVGLETGLGGPRAAWASEEVDRVTTRMGGLLEKYQDSRGGWIINCPSGWNKFEGEAGAYDVKWQDLVSPNENIKVSSTPVTGEIKEIGKLGAVEELGAKLATKRGAKLLSSEDRLTDGIQFYTFEFSVPETNAHQFLQLSVSKGKIWSLDANALGENRWEKRKDIYKNVLGSFMPKLS
ncbi:hypothetical protein TrVE_jg3938 [Triparma verrucosa]|uniref:PsbP C-terminal domain-containing protein n=1 Tax=Triparma verrucosa TaxID=1606542 RepID=A0A9W7EP70_9STRA|nr:hypothetical protein TrVE_jg3938 [Triparma verrucosa]